MNSVFWGYAAPGGVQLQVLVGWPNGIRNLNMCVTRSRKDFGACFLTVFGSGVRSHVVFRVLSFEFG